jgi:hypothetical protein
MTTPELNRRDFTRNVTAGLVGASAASTGLAVGSEQTEKPPENAAPEPETKEEPQEISEAGWMLGLILKRYPDERLDEASIRGIVGDIHADMARSRLLSSYPLENSDEPGYVFRPWRGE